MLNVRKRVDGIPIFDKLDRPLYHLNSDIEEQNSKKYVMVVDEINNIDGHFIELKDCLKEKYEKIDIYTTSPLSTNSYTIEDQYSIKSVLNWINKSVWNNKKKGKGIKINKSKSKYNGPINKEIPLIIRLFKYKNKDVEMNTIHCNIYPEENSIKAIEGKSNKKSKRLIKSNEMKKKQNKKKASSPKPNLLCIPIKPAKFSWLKRKENKNIDSNMSIDDFHFQSSDVSNIVPIQPESILNTIGNLDAVIDEQKIEKANSLERERTLEVNREIPNTSNVKFDISNEKNESVEVEKYNSNFVVSKPIRNKQNLQSLVIPTEHSFKSFHTLSARNLSASTLVNDQFDYLKCQEPTSYLPSPCNSTASTLVSPVDTKGEQKFEIDSCDYADFLKDKLNEDGNVENNDIERKHCSLPASPVNNRCRKGRKRSYAFSLTSNELNLIYSKANEVVISELCNTVENKQKSQPIKEQSSLSARRSENSESGKSFVKGHNRTQSRHRRSHAVCLSSDQIMNFGTNEDENNKQNRRKSRYNRESNGATLSTYAILNSNSNKNTTNKDTQLKRRSTNMIKYKESNSSLSSTLSSNRNSFCSNSGSIRPFSNNRLSRDIELLRAMKMKRSRSVPKLDQVDTSSPRSPTKSTKTRYSMDASTYNESIGISLRSNSINNYQPQSNIVYYSFSNKNDNKNNYLYDGYKNINKSGDTLNHTNLSNRWSNAYDNSSSCGSSTYYYSEEDGVHNNGNNVIKNKEELINYELSNKSLYSCKKESSKPYVQLAPPTPAIGMI